MKNKIVYQSNCRIVSKDDQKYLRKIRKSNKEELFEYLKNKGFQNFLPYIEQKKDYELYRYIEDIKIPKEDKAIELMYVLSLLHTTTTTYQDIDIDKMKELFETTKEKITFLRNYYLDLQDYIETKEFMSPAEQLLMRNISNFYKALNYSEYKLNSWYKVKEKTSKERIVQLHNNLSLEHFLKEDVAYLVNWDKAKKDYVIYDFINFYKHEYLNLEMTSLFELYQSKYQYTEEEQLLFESLISLPPQIIFNKTNYINTINTKNIVTYVIKTSEFLSKQNEENQESNHTEFEQ